MNKHKSLCKAKKGAYTETFFYGEIVEIQNPRLWDVLGSYFLDGELVPQLCNGGWALIFLSSRLWQVAKLVMGS